MVSGLETVLLTISGTVQGVGFRFYTRRLAIGLGLKGYVKNLDNGDVEIGAEGTRAAIDELVRSLKTGEMAGYITGIEERWGEPGGKYHDFSIEL
jgi:acylphosphatase